MNNDVELVKQKVDIVELIGQYVNLKRAGNNYKGPCPFHQEKTPSFMVSADKQIYKCFGCGEGGDIFSFVMNKEALEFGDALKVLAERAGVTLSAHGAPRIGEDKKSRLYRLNRFIALLTQRLLWQSDEAKMALTYLRKRGLTDDTIRQFTIGYMPQDTSFLIATGRKKGFGEQDLSASGAPQRLRERILFPLRDTMGNYLGFSGRALSDEQIPKYLNTPETIIFNKSRVLYDLPLAKNAIKEKDRAVLVEGQMDVIASHQAGVNETIASSGTALSELQLLAIFRLSQNLIIAFDSDTAGQKAITRALELALPIGFNIKIAVAKEGKDPGEIAIKDARGWLEILARAQDWLDWLWQYCWQEYQAHGQSETELDSQAKKTLAHRMAPYLNAINDPIILEEAKRSLAQKLAISQTALDELLAKQLLKAKAPDDTDGATTVKSEIDTEWQLLALLTFYPEHIALLPPSYLFTNKDVATIYKDVQKEYNKKDQKDPEALKKSVQSTLDKADKQKLALIALDLEQQFDTNNPANIAHFITDVIRSLQAKKREKVMHSFARQISEAEASGKREEVKQLLEELKQSIK